MMEMSGMGAIHDHKCNKPVGSQHQRIVRLFLGGLLAVIAFMSSLVIGFLLTRPNSTVDWVRDLLLSIAILTAVAVPFGIWQRKRLPGRWLSYATDALISGAVIYGYLVLYDWLSR
jgi:hypothetical protein